MSRIEGALQTLSKKNVADQSGSSLLQLPDELRLLILRELLFSEEPLLHELKYPRSARYDGTKKPKRSRNSTGQFLTAEVRGYHLYPAVLATCQTLWYEGSPIFYKENVIVVRIYHAGNSKLRIDFRPFKICILLDTAHGDTIEPAFLVCARKFAKFRLNIFDYVIHSHLPAVAKALVVLAPLLQDKEVQFKVDTFHRNANISEQVVENLKSLRALRCSKFFILANRSSRHLPELSDIVKTVTSNEPAINLLPSLESVEQLREFLFAGNAMIRGQLSTHPDTIQRKFNLLRRAACTLESETYNRVRRDLLELYRSCTQGLLLHAESFAGDDEVARDTR